MKFFRPVIRKGCGVQMNRREFVRVAGAAAMVAAQARGVALAAGADETMPTLFFMDGYHGGAVGHMPLGCWRDIVEAMQARPDWKLSLDVEAPSWEVLKREDPDSFSRVHDFIENRDGQGRMEITGGTFSQPYGWAITGESNIRQLQRGLELIHRQFRTARVETYAVQEPCWASCLPQILRSLGFTGASLKNASTAWGGYTQGFDAELVNWIGPDGTKIVAVPRYQCEELLGVWETEATEVTPGYARKCVEHGISEPVGMCFQDLGWAAQPRAFAAWIRYATWREYLHTIARKQPVDWKFTMEDILTALPWGEKTLHRATRQVRAAEVRLVAAEKFAAMAFLRNGSAWPGERLQRAWEQTMWSQAHDAWITVTTRTGRQAWAFEVAAKTMDAEQEANELIDEAAVSLCAERNPQPSPDANVQYLRAVNSLGQDREELVEAVVSGDRGTQSFEVSDAHGNSIPCQVMTTRRYRTLKLADGAAVPVIGNGNGAENSDTSINAATLLFRGTIPAFGWSTYKIRSKQERPVASTGEGIHTAVESDGSVVLESDLYRIRFDARRGGAIGSLYSKTLGKEFCAEGKLLNEFRGYFITQQKWCSSAENPARIDVLEQGPLRATVRMSGLVGGCKFRSTAAIVQGQERIDFHTAFQFDEDTWIGDPWDIKPEDRRKERRRSSNDGRWKLQAVFPAALDDCAVYKNSAFDVCRSRNASTHFQRWDEIKHNIITNWVDVFDAKRNLGLALFSDRTTAYSFGEGDPLGMILGWGWEAGYWWGKCPLRGEQESSYSIAPHGGLWNEAELWQQNARAEEPIVAQWMDSAPDDAAGGHSYLRLTPAEAVLSAVRVDGENLEVRVFHAQDRAGAFQLRFGFPISGAELIELDGRTASKLPMRRTEDGGWLVSVEVPGFGLRSVRVSVAGKADPISS
jgi:alpha-mannosidase